MIHYHLKQTDEKLSFQPNRRYGTKIVFCIIMAIAAFVLPRQLWPLKSDIMIAGRLLGGIFAGYAIYDLLFKIHLTYIFDRTDQTVYLKIPGLFTRTLMSFEEVYLLPESVENEWHYVMANKKDKYGRNYPISDFFTDGRRGKEEQAYFENTVLTALTDFMQPTGPARKAI